MSDQIQMEIVRLIKEIAEDEQSIRHAENCADAMCSDTNKLKYLNEADKFKESLNRKMELVKLLKS